MGRNEYFDRLTIAASQNIDEKQYWLSKLAGDLPRTHCPYDYENNGGDGYRTNEVKFGFSGEIFARLRNLSKENDQTLYLILIAGLVAVLNKYLDSNDIILGSPILKPTVEGDFINTLLALRTRLRDNITFKELLMDVRQTVMEAYRHQNYPIEVLTKQLNLQWSLDKFPLFDIAAMLTNIHDRKHIQPVRLNMVFSFSRINGHLEGVLAYNSHLYCKTTAERIAGHLGNFFRSVLFDPDSRVADVEIMSEEEKRRVIVDFNSTEAEYRRDTDIYTRFEEQVEKHPGRKAITIENRQLTYKELHREAGKLAVVLEEKGVGPDIIVGIMADRSLEMFIAIFAVLQAGGAYLPVDPQYPVDRIKFMLEDSGARVLLSEVSRASKVSGDTDMIDLPSFLVENKNREPKRLIRLTRPTHLCYVIYTSGSTGKPKGVMIEHCSLVNRLNWMQKKYPLGAKDIILHKTTFTFDVSVWEIFWWAVEGAGVCLLSPGAEKDPETIANTALKIGTTVMHFVPSMLSAFLDYIKENKESHKLSSLKQVIASGEALTLSQVDLFGELLHKGNKTQLANLYGPTEATIDVSYFDCFKREKQDCIPIGKPIDNIKLFIFNTKGQLQPPGIPGELCIAGIGLARGYSNRPGLTAEKFLFLSYRSPRSYRSHISPKMKLYKTGDLARWLPDGNIQFIGRIDSQVKIRGFRIELGEIENLLLACKSIKNAVVTTRENKDGDRLLCAYVVVDGNSQLPDLEKYLMESLSQRLPHFMIPTHFLALEKIPLTANGKVDRKALHSINIAPKAGYVEPRNEMEKLLLEIWKRVLNRESLGVTDKFLYAGGDSIKAIKVVSAINKQLDIDLKPADIYFNQTIENLAGKIKRSDKRSNKESLEAACKEAADFCRRVMENNTFPGDVEDIYPMSEIQKGMLFYYLKNSEVSVYHDQTISPVGYKNFDLEKARHALELMTEKHEILRTGFLLEEFSQVVFKKVKPVIHYFDISHMSPSQQEEHLKEYLEKGRQNPFLITTPPLWRMSFFKAAPGNFLIAWELNHAILDGWSSASFFTEFNNVYVALQTNPSLSLEKLKCSHKEFIISQMAEKTEAGAVDYWRKELEDYKRLTFPKTNEADKLEYMTIDLGLELREKLESTAVKHNTNLKHLGFAAYVYMLNMLCCEADILAGLVTFNRPIREDGDKLLGCFLNTIPVRVKITDHITWLDYIHRVDRKMNELDKYGTLSLFEIMNIVGERTGNKNPFFDTLFNYIDFNIFDEINPFNIEEYTANDLSLGTYEKGNTFLDFTINTRRNIFHLILIYSPVLVSSKDAEKLTLYFRRILNIFVDPWQIEKEALKNDILTEEEIQVLLYDFNATGSGYPSAKTIHELFEEQVEKTPDVMAVVGRGTKKGEPVQLTYNELNRKSFKLAHLLKEKIVLVDSIVGIMLERSVDMIIGILGILKSGGAYLPIDPGYPRERIDYMLKDSGVKILVTDYRAKDGEKSIKWESMKSIEILFSDTLSLPSLRTCDFPNFLTSQPPNFPFLPVIGHRPPATSLAYVIYTSGTTGKPKGVAIEHRSLVNRLNWMQKKYPLDQNDTILQKTTFTFDVSVWEIFWWSIVGAKVCLLIPGGEKDPETITLTVERNNVTTIHFVPSMLSVFLDYLEGSGDVKKLSGLKRVIASGEALLPPHVERFNILLNNENGTVLSNLYGPTEATIDVTYFDCSKGGEKEIIPIGKPIDNIYLYIMDKHLQIKPIGVSGELCLSGIGLARGYLNHPELTAERFIYFAHELHELKQINKSFWGSRGLFSKRSLAAGGIFYRTGDLARWLPDGNVEFLGRIDQQVKIRGFRVELGEIESQLQEIGGIKQACVIHREKKSGEKYLCAYLVTEEPVDPNDIRNTLGKRLPDYMVPLQFIPIERIPLTPNGKIDKRALLAVTSDAGLTRNIIAPKSNTEKIMARIWMEVLELDKVGVTDNFFDIGGTSLDILRVSNRMKETFNRDIPMSHIFQYPNIGALAGYFDREESENGFSQDERPDAIERGKIDRMRRLQKKKRGGNP